VLEKVTYRMASPDLAIASSRKHRMVIFILIVQY